MVELLREGYIALWLILNFAMVGVYDIWVTFQANGDQTVSSVIYRWCLNWPLLAAFMGGLLIHLLGLGPAHPLIKGPRP